MRNCATSLIKIANKGNEMIHQETLNAAHENKSANVKAALKGYIISAKIWLDQFDEHKDSSALKCAKFSCGCFFGAWEMAKTSGFENVTKELESEFQIIYKGYESLDNIPPIPVSG